MHGQQIGDADALHCWDLPYCISNGVVKFAYMACRVVIESDAGNLLVLQR